MTHSCNSQHMVTGQTQIDVSGVNKGKYDRNGRKRIWGNSQKGEILPLLLMGGGGCAMPVNAGLTETCLKITRIWKQCL